MEPRNSIQFTPEQRSEKLQALLALGDRKGVAFIIGDREFSLKMSPIVGPTLVCYTPGLGLSKFQFTKAGELVKGSDNDVSPSVLNYDDLIDRLRNTNMVPLSSITNLISRMMEEIAYKFKESDINQN